ncbi:SGNH/GDSL hydrolase family protein [Brachybacterium hainanense]|uniref:SGNH/GDSL hydrolase family protein n=1 Tax=Brachybacterium hainanense TaxID=1541174 RepID=A0ABV6R9U2_9MICO
MEVYRSTGAPAVLYRTDGTPVSEGGGPVDPPGPLTAWRALLAAADTTHAVMVAAGDSLTDMDATSIDSTGWTANLARQLTSHTPGTVDFHDVGALPGWAPAWGAAGVHIVNVAISGRTSYNYVHATETIPQIVAAGPTIVTHMIGMNDYNFSLRTPVQVADEIVTRMGMIDTALTDVGKDLPAHVVMVEPRDASLRPEQPFDWWDSYGTELARIVNADRTRRILVNIDQAFGDTPGLRGPDDIHLTTAGYQVVADTMLSALI